MLKHPLTKRREVLVNQFSGTRGQNREDLFAQFGGRPIPFGDGVFDIFALDDKWEISRKLPGAGPVRFSSAWHFL